MASPSGTCDFGWQAPQFYLPGTDGCDHSLDGLMGSRGLVVVFICKHCPYVIAIAPRLEPTARALRDLGIGMAAICANDAQSYPADGFDNMKKFAAEHGFGFPYLHDETQEVARAWGAVCTPDFFGLNAAGALQYRGRLDDAGRGPVTPDTRPELLTAMRSVAETGAGPREQTPAVGCSIKWKSV
jgi:peroxiredoxin